MYNYELPFGYSRMDVVSGTVTRSTWAGVEILLDNEGSESEGSHTAFARCMGSIGQRVLVSLQYYNDRRGNFFCRLDGYLDDAAAQMDGAIEKPKTIAACAA